MVLVLDQGVCPGRMSRFDYQHEEMTMILRNLLSVNPGLVFELFEA
jgi:hypothetical protein